MRSTSPRSPASLVRVSPARTLIDDAMLLESHALADLLTRSSLSSGPVRPDTLVVSDQQLAALDRLVTGVDRVPVTVLNTSGAGGLISLAARSTPHLEIHAVRSPLRDLDDLPQNAARVVAAAVELGGEIDVYVELPHAWGWERAAEVVEIAGLFGGLRVAGSVPARTAPMTTDPTLADPTLTTRMSALVELDLGFALDARALAPSTIPALLACVDALVDDASTEEAAALLGGGTPIDLSAWDAHRQARVARRLRRVLMIDVEATRAALTAAGLPPV